MKIYVIVQMHEIKKVKISSIGLDWPNINKPLNVVRFELNTCNFL